jgi:uncharacterized UBP type Zn finger protein
MVSEQGMALNAATPSANGSAPRCEHLDGLAPVTPTSGFCQDCGASDDRRASLLVCLTCGWVACSDTSPHQHAKAHYQESDHPIAAAMDQGPRWRWCYVHERLV